jgi:hypothetical protein
MAALLFAVKVVGEQQVEKELLLDLESPMKLMHYYCY